MNKQIKETQEQEKPMENLQRLSWKSKMYLTHPIQIIILTTKAKDKTGVKKKKKDKTTLNRVREAATNVSNEYS